MSLNTIVEKLERYSILLDTYSIYYYPSTNEMTIEFFSDIDEEEYEVTIYDVSGFHLEESPIKDEVLLTTYLNLFKEQK